VGVIDISAFQEDSLSCEHIRGEILTQWKHGTHTLVNLEIRTHAVQARCSCRLSSVATRLRSNTSRSVGSNSDLRKLFVSGNMIPSINVLPATQFFHPKNATIFSGVTGGGEDPPGVTPEWNKKWQSWAKYMWLNLQRTVDKRGRTGKKRSAVTLSRGWHPTEIKKVTVMSKRGRQFFSGKNRGDTVSCPPGDTNPSDAIDNLSATVANHHLLGAVSSLTYATQRKQRNERNVRKRWPMTWLEFVTWYGLRRIRGVFWTLRCLRCLRCVALSAFFIAVRVWGWKPRFSYLLPFLSLSVTAVSCIAKCCRSFK